MKNAILVLMTLVAINNINAQRITKIIDTMGDEIHYSARGFSLVDKEAETGFRFMPWLEADGRGLYGIILSSVRLGNCVEDSELIILLENGKKIKIKSWNDFNCEGTSYFSLTSGHVKILLSSPLKTIRFTNGETYDSQTSDVPSHEKNTFMEIMEDIKNKRYNVVEE